MYKTTIIIIAYLALSMGCHSCQKDAKTYTDRGDRLIYVQTGEKTGNSYLIFVNLGHNDITATTTDTFGLTNQDFFLMPDRSLSYTDGDDNQIYLNIPAQLVFRDEDTQQFTFTGLSFSGRPLY